MVQLRGEKCYTIRALDETKYKYRVLRRAVRDSPTGFLEVLQDNQEYQRFLTMEEAEEHFFKVEAGGDLMLPPEMTVNNSLTNK